MSAPQANAFRDTWAGELAAADAGHRVRVAGWVHRRRDHGGLIFIDLRDRSGLLQIVFHPETSGGAFALAERLRPEHVVSISGEVVLREPGNVNPALATGEIEVSVGACEVLAQSETPPFPIDEDTPVDETLRLRYRWLDLRRQGMLDAMLTRTLVVRTMRRVLDDRGFLELETPILTRSTPEGARDFLVPSRLSPGTSYALPQSPQLFKQLLMMAGYERYYQIARCFRDEDLRADRQPEFTQLDLEMAFVAEDDVIEVMEAVMASVFAATDFDVPPTPWPQMSYDAAVARFGVDRPDTRFGLEIRDVSDQLRGSEFKVFEGVLAAGGVVRAVNAGARELSRSELDGLNEVVQVHGAKAVAPITVQAEEPGWAGNLAKFFRPDQIASVNTALEAAPGDLLLFVADQPRTAAAALGGLRLHLGERFGLIPADRHDPVWIRDFPMAERRSRTRTRRSTSPAASPVCRRWRCPRATTRGRCTWAAATPSRRPRAATSRCRTPVRPRTRASSLPAPPGARTWAAKSTTLAQLGVVSRPVPKLTLSADLRYVDRNDKTPIAQYIPPPPVTAGQGTGTYDGTNEPRSVEQWFGKVEASYQLPMAFRAIGAIDYQQVERNVYAVRSVSIRFKTEETSYRAELRRSFAEEFTGAIAYIYSQRDGSSFQTNVLYGAPPPTFVPVGSNSIAPLHLADRDRSRLRFSLNWAPIEPLSVTFFVDVAKDDYGTRSGGLGLQEGKFQNYSIDASYAFNPDWQVTAWYWYNTTSADQSTCQSAAAAGGACPATAANPVWQANLSNTSNAVGLGLRGKPWSETEIGADFQYQSLVDKYDQFPLRPGTSAVVQPISDIDTKLTTFKLWATYALAKNSGIRLDYIFDRFDTNDWTWTSWVYSDGTTVTQEPRQTVNFLGVSYYYRFQ